MRTITHAAIILCLIGCLFFPYTADTAFGASSAASSKIVSVLPDGTPLLEDGSVWVTYEDQPLHLNLNLASIAGGSTGGYGMTKDGGLVVWDNYFEESYIRVKNVSNVKQVSSNYWLLADGTVWTVNNGITQVESLNGTLLMDERADSLAAVSDSGKILKYRSSYSQPGIISDQVDAASIRKIQANERQIAVLYKDGKVVMYEDFHFDENAPKLIYKPETLAEDAVDISLSSSTLLVAKKDGSVWSNGTTSDTVYTLSQITGISGIQEIVGGTAKKFYARQADGTWVSFNSGTISVLTAPQLQSISLTVSNSKPKVTEIIKASVTLHYNDGTKAVVPLGQVKATIDKPHLIKVLEDGTIKAAGVGEATMKVEADGVQQSVKIASSLKDPLSNAKQVNGVTYLPLKSVFQALGGTVNYQSASKSFSIAVGPTSIVITKGSAKAKVNGKTVEMKGAPIEEKGETLFAANLLASALGAGLKWDSANGQMTVSIGAGQLIVKTPPKAAPKPVSTLYAVPATGEMAGMKILKGHPYEKTARIYFTFKKPASMQVTIQDIRKIDLNKKITWTDEYGNKWTNTVGELHRLFAAISSQYSSEYLHRTFGDVYFDWRIGPVDTDTALRLVEQYLIETGQMQKLY
ncbi:copper amine oxidase N-terminal domain-containing protein [Paenibacillus oenotherae]|uniref:Copper amine oxidase N-terminal domain-containing protein n=1 Tax=Paenibacillus oenotherae TaxID=1435645 RepID=A0ABS7D6B8_9BACL|nr:copper amine oxidase N-terminal domain-containing protein [Paenibacillus oenotherae]MBW7475473.1 copper amine oxidase N-terminal domain-containing protein [Paenibacillus oenotherae]